MNLIVTCARHFEPETREELEDILRGMGDSDARISITKISGILTAETSLEPVKTVREIREALLDEPWSIRYCQRIIPIQRFIKTGIKEMVETVAEISDQISDGETYKITVEKRGVDLSSREIITEIADKIRNKVSLEFPDKVILIEIIGNKTGISILEETDVLSVEKAKRSMSE